MWASPGTRDADHREPAAPDDHGPDHWRRLAAERADALHALRQRPLVRAALFVDRRASPAARSLRSLGRSWRSIADRSGLVVVGTVARAQRRRRARALRAELSQLAAPPSPPTTTIATSRSSVDDRWRAHAGGSPEIVAVPALGRAAAVATGDVVCFVPEALEAPEPGWLAHLAAAIGDGVVAATPTVLHPARPGLAATHHDLLVRSAGFDVSLDPAGAPIVSARAAGTGFRASVPQSDVVAAPLAGLAVDRAALLAAGGLGLDEPDDVSAVALCLRLRAFGRVRHVPHAVVVDPRPVTSQRALRSPIDHGGHRWRAVVDDHGAALARTALPAHAPLRWAITTAAPSAKVAPRWGDWHFAEAMARAMRALGHDVAVQTLDRADDAATRARDVHLVLHGLGSVRRTRGQRHVLWIISHPETVDLEECDAADLVLVASPRFAEHLRGLTTTPVEVLLQATDPHRFRPTTPDPEHRHPVVVVAKTRDVLRPIVADALRAGVRPAIYGSGWERLVDPDLVVQDHVDNASLATIYCGAGVVLNDHWAAMRDWGFVSNRIFDTLACGAPVVSDHTEAISELFGDAVPTYETPTELGEHILRALDDPEGARRRADQGRAIVLARHTFEHRAGELMSLLERYELTDREDRGGPRE